MKTTMRREAMPLELRAVDVPQERREDVDPQEVREVVDPQEVRAELNREVATTTVEVASTDMPWVERPVALALIVT